MALTPFVRATQGRALATVENPDTASVRLTQSRVLAAVAQPTEAERITQAHVLGAVESDTTIRLTQTRVLVAVRGRISDNHVRSWTFTLDGHDYYVIRLGNYETLVYDTHSQQWYTWASGAGNIWRAYNGWNWSDNQFGTTTVYVGDDGNGSIYFLDPDKDTDDDALFGSAISRTFKREITGQVASKSYDRMPCYGVNLIGSTGVPGDSAVTLYISDDRGNTYVDCGDVAVDAEDFDSRLDWNSLGSIRLPGRLFKVRDDGALRRIDALEMVENKNG